MQLRSTPLQGIQRSDKSRRNPFHLSANGFWGIVYPILLALTRLRRSVSAVRYRANIFASEFRSFLHRIGSEPCKRGFLVASLDMANEALEQFPSLHSSIPCGMSYIKCLAAEKPWLSISDLSLCLESYEAARLYTRRNPQSCIEESGVQPIQS
jgi:hypothetical protein